MFRLPGLTDTKLLVVILSLSLTGAVSQVVKVLVGRPRPDLIARCQPVLGTTNTAIYGLVTSAICTQKDIYIMRDGFRSFPSAHSSRTRYDNIEGFPTDGPTSLICRPRVSLFLHGWKVASIRE